TFAILIPALVGLGLMMLGTLIGIFATANATATAERAERLPVFDAAALDRRALGTEGAIDGRISDRSAPHYQQLVAYTREEYRGSDEDDDGNTTQRWVEDLRHTPLVLVEAGRGLVEIRAGYELRSPPHTLQDDEVLFWNGLTGEGTRRYRGFIAGDAVFAIGRTVAGPEGAQIEAEFRYGGARAGYIAEQRRTAAATPWIGALFGVIGLIPLGISAWQLRRRMR
ncbi:MAG TPA: hypothetical protein PKC19_23635, partial [Roseiflexaceae bacterium]|nr:hypothetical protein [Roseiflexaceae bacterium]